MVESFSRERGGSNVKKMEKSNCGYCRIYHRYVAFIYCLAFEVSQILAKSRGYFSFLNNHLQQTERREHVGMSFSLYLFMEKSGRSIFLCLFLFVASLFSVRERR